MPPNAGTVPNLARILVDDRPTQLLTGVKIGQNSALVDVPARDCKISIITQNEFGASVPAVVNLKRNEFIFKPTLYILAIGVSKYNNPDLQLQFAAKDAIDFSLSMVQQQGLLYEKVELRLLTDEQANADNIRDGLQWLKTETTFGDVAMLYMAGHGINDNVGDFFFMPVNADLKRINATCVGYREIKGALDANAGKMLVFMDACHSGNVLGNNQRRAAMLTQAITELTSADNGAVVFTSSTGRQFSLENPEWNNGAFTKALVEGLNGAADLFKTQTITVNSLSSYVANRVKELTNGQQAPTTIIPSSVPDFPVAVVSINMNAKIETPITVTNQTSSTEQTKQQLNNQDFHKVQTKYTKEYSKYYAGLLVGFEVLPYIEIFGIEGAYFFNHLFGAGFKIKYYNYKYSEMAYIAAFNFHWGQRRFDKLYFPTMIGLEYHNGWIDYTFGIDEYIEKEHEIFPTLHLGIAYRPVKNLSIKMNVEIGYIVGKTLGINYHF